MPRIRTLKPEHRQHRKVAIPNATRMTLVLRHHRRPLPKHVSLPIPCHWCGSVGYAYWWGKAGWIALSGLEIDHVIPECLGGPTVATNLVLACRPCNRSRGWRHAVPPRLKRA